MTSSSSRLTLLPFVLVGSSERTVVPPDTVGVSPLPSWALSADSKSVRPARKPGVLTLAMLSAVTRCRCASPERAACSAVMVVSSMRFIGGAGEDGGVRGRGQLAPPVAVGEGGGDPLRPVLRGAGRHPEAQPLVLRAAGA